MSRAFNALNAGLLTFAAAACASGGGEPPSPAPAPLPEAAMLPPEPIFVCPGGARAKVDGDLALVIDGGEALRLPRGATLRRFEGDDASLVVGGGVAVLERPGQAPRRCLLQSELDTAPALPITAGGNEPGWSLRIGPDRMTMETDYGATRVTVPTPAPRLRGRIATWEATEDGRTIEALISPGPCRDDMSGLPYPMTAEVRLDGDYHRGCAGEPVDLLLGDWTASGAGYGGAEPPTLSFAPNGRVSGNTGCNALNGQYALTGEGLRIGPVAMTRRACFGPAGEQEAAFLDAIERAYRFGVEPDGALVLIGGSGELRLVRSTR